MNAVAYARYSTDNQTIASIEMQFRVIREYCAKNSINIIGEFYDEALTGTNMARSGFANALHAAAQDNCDGVIIYQMWRASRDVVDWFTFREKMRELGKFVMSATETLGDISDPSSFLIEGVTAVIGQHQVLQTRKSSIDGKRTRAAKGLFCGGIPPLGYDIVNAQYVINPREAEAIKLIFDLYAAGKSYSHICERVAQLGVVGKRGQAIGNNTLCFILRNIRYTGLYLWFDEEVRYMRKHVGKKHPDPVAIPGVIPRIISDDTWRAVQKRMDANKKNTLNKSRADRVYLLSGLLKCGICGGAYSGHTTTVKMKNGVKGEYKGYSCTNKTRLHTCTNKRIKADDIETLVVGLVKNSILNGDIIEKTADAILEAIRDHVGLDKTSIKKEITKLEGAIVNLMKSLDYDNDDVRQLVQERIAEHTARIKILKEQLGDAEAMPEVSRDELIKQLRADSQRLSEDPGAMRELLHKYIVRVDIAPGLITIHAVSDLAEPKPLHVLPNPYTQKSVDKDDQNPCQHDWLLR